MEAVDTYLLYCSLKAHFNGKYDYHKFGGRTKISRDSFWKRKDRIFFVKLAQMYIDDVMLNYFISNFISSEDPAKVWIGEIIQNGETNFKEWQKRNQSLSYICLLYTSPSPRDVEESRMPSSA